MPILYDDNMCVFLFDQSKFDFLIKTAVLY